MRCFALTVVVFTTATTTAATTTASLAEQEYGGTAAIPQGQSPQQWKDAGRPWGDAGRQLKNIWGGIAGDARQIGPATRQDFRTKPRWDWSGGDGTAPIYENAPTQSIRMQPQYAPANPVYLPVDSQPIYVPQESYSYPVETVPYSDPIPSVEQGPTYEMAPVN